jgi:flagellar biosynthesis activator protein FlaF
VFPDARSAYRAATQANVSSRKLESAALFNSARRIEDALADWGSPGCEARLADALEQNQRLWTFFQAELTEHAHPMPTELRQALLTLIRFVDRRTFELIAHPDPGAARALVDINRNIATGLQAGPDTAPGRAA